jgi:gliding motility-associated-like protein
MKRFLSLILFCLIWNNIKALHITGGEIIYQYSRPGSTTNSRIYRIVVKLFRDENCQSAGGQSCAPLPDRVSVGIFNNDNSILLNNRYYVIYRSAANNVPKNPQPKCLTNPPLLDYKVGIYSLTDNNGIFEIELPANSNGYTVALQTCCRINNLQNSDPSGVGSTFTAVIPPLIDNSPQFSVGVDVICFKKPFRLDFSAEDPDPQDSLVYSFCGAYNGGNATDASFTTAAPPPYGFINYRNGFTAVNPLGNKVTIDSKTGIISGIAPDEGKYVVSVCISVYRNGVYIGEHRKDYIITVASCDFAGTELNPEYITCGDFRYSFSNLNNSPLNQTYYWDFGDPGSGAANISTAKNPVHIFSDTGIFNIKLVVNRGDPCSDSAFSRIKVYPGFIPEFDGPGTFCINQPYPLQDETTSQYGIVNYWRWDFGVSNATDDTSNLQNPTYTYYNPGTYDVTLITGNSKGCLDTVSKRIEIRNKPDFNIRPRDTLICTVDTIRMTAAGGSGGTVSWSPNYEIENANSFNTRISPDVSTTYYALYTDSNGCTLRDSARINVVIDAFVIARNDTTICLKDPVQLSVNTNALYFEWGPASLLNDPSSIAPTATPLDSVTFFNVKASISNKCFKYDQVKVIAIPYPNAKAGSDTSVCIGESATITATGGSNYQWSPSIFLNDNTISQPLVNQPQYSITYTVAVRDNKGCPKPSFDSVRISVFDVQADAGPRDTSVVAGQPLQLQGTGGSLYSWDPSTWLNDPNISNPFSLPKSNIQYVLKVIDGPGCFSYDTIDVKYYNFPAGIQMPNAFTPNGDGLNDIFRPIPIGMISLDLFSVYNRYGQMVYSTTDKSKGWDGSFGGKAQDPGTYVWLAEGIDYNKKKVKVKGTVMLIR